MAETQKDAEYQFNSSIYPVTLDLELDSSKSMLRDMPTRLDLRKIGDGGDLKMSLKRLAAAIAQSSCTAHFKTTIPSEVLTTQ